jgi:hypothetical protein
MLRREGSTVSDQDNPTLTEVVDKLAQAGDEDGVSVDDVLAEFGDRTLAPILLVPALITATPISGIPGVPTLTGIIVGLIVVQMLMGRDRLWVPRAVARQQISKERMEKAMRFLRKPVGFIDRLLKPRMTWLADRPWNYVALIICFAIALITPVMELLPFVITIAAMAIALFATGIFTRDGIILLAGYALFVITIIASVMVA